MSIAELDQGGLGLPEKDYYFRADPKSVEIRKKYVAHISKMFSLDRCSSRKSAETAAATVMSVETALAKASLDVTARRDPQKLFHQMSKAELAKLSPNFSFEQFLPGGGAHHAFEKVNVDVPDFIAALSQLVATRPIGRSQGLPHLALRPLERPGAIQTVC